VLLPSQLTNIPKTHNWRTERISHEKERGKEKDTTRAGDRGRGVLSTKTMRRRKRQHNYIKRGVERSGGSGEMQGVGKGYISKSSNDQTI